MKVVQTPTIFRGCSPRGKIYWPSRSSVPLGAGTDDFRAGTLRKKLNWMSQKGYERRLLIERRTGGKGGAGFRPLYLPDSAWTCRSRRGVRRNREGAGKKWQDPCQAGPFFCSSRDNALVCSRITAALSPLRMYHRPDRQGGRSSSIAQTPLLMRDRRPP